MTIERKISRLFSLNDETWMRHANPWSVWTRYSVLPLIVLAFWSRDWIGWWHAFPAAISLGWMFLNPLFFPRPKTTKNWASKAVLGERVYLDRDKVKIPLHHTGPTIKILNAISSIGMLAAILGIVYLHVWLAVLGVALAYLGKSWYLDRMVWLYEDMKGTNPTYQSWEY